MHHFWRQTGPFMKRGFCWIVPFVVVITASICIWIVSMITCCSSHCHCCPVFLPSPLVRAFKVTSTWIGWFVFVTIQQAFLGSTKVLGFVGCASIMSSRYHYGTICYPPNVQSRFLLWCTNQGNLLPAHAYVQRKAWWISSVRRVRSLFLLIQPR